MLEEIEERREFLTEMEGLGQGEKYRNKIMTEISQVNINITEPSLLCMSLNTCLSTNFMQYSQELNLCSGCTPKNNLY